jgi:hypothetical protein
MAAASKTEISSKKIGTKSIKKCTDVSNNLSKLATASSMMPETLLDNRKSKERFDITDQEFEDAVQEMEYPDEFEPHIVFVSTTPIDEWIKANFQ